MAKRDEVRFWAVAGMFQNGVPPWRPLQAVYGFPVVVTAAGHRWNVSVSLHCTVEDRLRLRCAVVVRPEAALPSSKHLRLSRTGWYRRVHQVFEQSGFQGQWWNERHGWADYWREWKSVGEMRKASRRIQVLTDELARSMTDTATSASPPRASK